MRVGEKEDCVQEEQELGEHGAREWRGTEGQAGATCGLCGRATPGTPQKAAGPRQIPAESIPWPGLAGAPTGGNCRDTSRGQRKQREASGSTTLSKRKETGTLFPQLGTQAHSAGEVRQSKNFPERGMGPRTQLLPNAEPWQHRSHIHERTPKCSVS